MIRHWVFPGFLALILLASGGRAWAQGNVLFPGSTPQGDILRGVGVAYRGAAISYLNAAKARSIDADTAMRFHEYVYRSYQEYLRQRARRGAQRKANRKASLAEIERRLRESPTDTDLASGDALNAALVDLADPLIDAKAWETARVDLPAGAARSIPFQHATVGGTFTLRRLDGGDAWPVALRYKTLEEPRRAYRRAVATLLEQCRGHRLTPEALEAVGAAARDLGSRAEAAIPPASQDYRRMARQFTGSLERTARALTRSAYVEDLLGELDGYRGPTVSDLVDLMRRYTLHFGPAESPEERGLYTRLYPQLREQRVALGLPVNSVLTAGMRHAEAGARRAEDGAPRPHDGAKVLGNWKRFIAGREQPPVRLYPDGGMGRPGGPNRWSFDGSTLVLRWPNRKDALGARPCSGAGCRPTVGRSRGGISWAWSSRGSRSSTTGRPSRWRRPRGVLRDRCRSVEGGRPLSQHWDIKRSDRISGPVSISELRQQAADGRLAADAWVSPDRQHWVRATQVKGLNFPASTQDNPSSQTASPTSQSTGDDPAPASGPANSEAGRGAGLPGAAIDEAVTASESARREWVTAKIGELVATAKGLTAKARDYARSEEAKARVEKILILHR